MEWINFCKTFSKILTEQGIKDNAQAKYTMARMLLKGDALKQFEAKALRVDESNNNFNECMKVMAIHIFPNQALAKQKHYMRCYMKKSQDMKVQQLAANLQEMVDDFKYYPPFVANQALPVDEVINIFEDMMPPKWKQ